MRAALAAGAVLLGLSACQAASEEPGRAPSAVPSPGGAPVAGTPPASVAPVPPRTAPDPFAIRADRNRSDMVPGCARQNPATRPRGSNCYGIFPEQCGADLAAAYLGDALTPDIRTRIEAIRPPDGVRFIRPGDAVTEDLRFGRLNVELDRQDRIARVDCY